MLCPVVLASVLANVNVYESKLHAVTEGDAVLHCAPEVAYRAATDYARWREIFHGVRGALIKTRQGDEARVTFVHDDGSRDDLHFVNRSRARTIWFEQIGGDAEVWCQIAFQPGAQPGTTRVHTWFYADVHGAKSWFVSGSKVRNLRQQQVRDDLQQLVAYFSRK
jgi:hypothetical protein